MTTSLADYCRDRRSTDTALTGGTWQRQGLVMVWVPDETPDWSHLIACPTCEARLDQPCVTKNGGRQGYEHAGRIIPRRCACGAVLRKGHKRCDPCALEVRRASWREYRRRTYKPKEAA